MSSEDIFLLNNLPRLEVIRHPAVADIQSYENVFGIQVSAASASLAKFATSSQFRVTRYSGFQAAVDTPEIPLLLLLLLLLPYLLPTTLLLPTTTTSTTTVLGGLTRE